MGSVLSFKPRVAASGPRRPPAGSVGSIVIFPGVRYEHQKAPPCAEIVVKSRAESRKDQPKPRR